MLIRHRHSIRPSEITPEKVFRNRRQLLRDAGLAGSGLFLAAGCAAEDDSPELRKLDVKRGSPFSTDESPNSFEDIISYNNFYEFGLDKSDPARHAGKFKPKPWTVTVAGEAAKTGTFDFDDIVGPHDIEERVYRFRCVEAWSMVIPWNGIPLGDMLKRFEPTSKAKYVAFETVVRPEEMPGQRRRVLDFPYVEGLTIEEAMHPLTLMAIGVYGVELPNQNGAPIRLVVPWKYGFKSIKSIVKITFTEQEPPTTWNLAAPREYGFYANVNPEVDHPRWSQARERRIGGGFFDEKQPTLMLNGYGEQVASLYEGLDLRKFY
ncbi:MAG: protein-methionine-sulfoxide reductase catalytic subunit MsrP [Gammaproteobacteria bacterium]|nr:protein-methionine-sulfoxide reductase catalytic subunit MsrP [Gammaproteobacteria bacterium]